MAGATDTQELNVNTVRMYDLLLIGEAVLLQRRGFTVEEVRLVNWQVDVLEEMVRRRQEITFTTLCVTWEVAY